MPLHGGSRRTASATFNFVPRTAGAVFDAVYAGDDGALARFERDFLNPYVRLRSRGAGYAVGLVKAGAAVAERSAGNVRPPLADPTPAEQEELRGLIARLGPQD